MAYNNPLLGYLQGAQQSPADKYRGTVNNPGMGAGSGIMSARSSLSASRGGANSRGSTGRGSVPRPSPATNQQTGWFRWGASPTGWGFRNAQGQTAQAQAPSDKNEMSRVIRSPFMGGTQPKPQTPKPGVISDPNVGTDLGQDEYGRHIAKFRGREDLVYVKQGGKWTLGYSVDALQNPAKYGLKFNPVATRKDQLAALVEKNPQYQREVSDKMLEREQKLSGLQSLLNAVQYRDPFSGLTRYEAYEKLKQADAARAQSQALGALSGRGYGRSGATRIARSDIAKGLLSDLASASGEFGAGAESRTQSDIEATRSAYQELFQRLYDAAFEQAQQEEPVDLGTLPAVPIPPARTGTSAGGGTSGAIPGEGRPTVGTGVTVTNPAGGGRVVIDPHKAGNVSGQRAVRFVNGAQLRNWKGGSGFFPSKESPTGYAYINARGEMATAKRANALSGHMISNPFATGRYVWQ